jgi:hypothetical protein
MLSGPFFGEFSRDFRPKSPRFAGKTAAFAHANACNPDDPELVIRNHDMLAVGGAGGQPLIVGAKPRTLPPLDLEGEIAIEQVAELNVGQGEIIAAKKWGAA